MPEISVIILTYNSSGHIEKLLKSLISKYKKEIESGVLEIIVGDNSSLDNTLEIVKKIKEISVFENGGNFGFAKGINLTSSHAKGKFLLFINPDSVLSKGDIFELKNRIDGKFSIAGGEAMNMQGKRELSCGKFYTPFNVLLLALGLEEKLGVRFSPKNDGSVPFVSGGFMMVEADSWKKLGGFDEKLFMYTEDMELCFRAKQEGLGVIFSNAATIEHAGQASSSRSFAVVNIYKGILYFNKKHMGKIAYLFVKFVLLLKAFVLVMIGKMSNNQYLDRTYREAISASI